MSSSSITSHWKDDRPHHHRSVFPRRGHHYFDRKGYHTNANLCSGRRVGRLTQRSEKPITCASLGIGSIVVGAIPGRQYYTSPLSLPLTHPQSCRAWSMSMTWQQVEIMRGESPKSYERATRGHSDLS